MGLRRTNFLIEVQCNETGKPVDFLSLFARNSVQASLQAKKILESKSSKSITAYTLVFRNTEEIKSILEEHAEWSSFHSDVDSFTPGELLQQLLLFNNQWDTSLLTVKIESEDDKELEMLVRDILRESSERMRKWAMIYLVDGVGAHSFYSAATYFYSEWMSEGLSLTQNAIRTSQVFYIVKYLNELAALKEIAPEAFVVESELESYWRYLEWMDVDADVGVPVTED